MKTAFQKPQRGPERPGAHGGIIRWSSSSSHVPTAPLVLTVLETSATQCASAPQAQLWLSRDPPDAAAAAVCFFFYVANTRVSATQACRSRHGAAKLHADDQRNWQLASHPPVSIILTSAFQVLVAPQALHFKPLVLQLKCEALFLLLYCG